jgi:biopolymer transport protein ExbD
MKSDAAKLQRKRKRIDEDGDPEFQVAPMVDVLLVLMLFFMAITSTEVLKKNKNLTLPQANHAKPHSKPDPNELVVNVAWDSIKQKAELSMDEIDYASADAIGTALGAQHQKNPKAFVLIRADKDVQYSDIADLMTACGGVGINSVTFSVLTGGAQNNNHAQAPAADPGAGGPTPP